MLRTALAFVLFALSSSAFADHFVYIYSDTYNTSYSCKDHFRTYVDWTGYGNSYYFSCEVTGTDTAVWNPTSAIDTHTAHLDPIGDITCKFVAFADIESEKSLVLDCRTN